MTLEEFKERVLYLLYKGMDDAEKSQTQRELRKLLIEEPDMFECEYRGTCYYYDLGQPAFSDGLLDSRTVGTILMCL